MTCTIIHIIIALFDVAKAENQIVMNHVFVNKMTYVYLLYFYIEILHAEERSEAFYVFKEENTIFLLESKPYSLRIGTILLDGLQCMQR